MYDFRRWSKTDDVSMKAKFYPNITKQGIYDGKYIGNVSEHSWGIAVDLTLVDLRTGRELDMGGHHDLLDVSSATRTPLITAAQQANRLKLRDAMAAAGLRNYSREWWHYFLIERGTVYSYNFEVRDDLLTTP
jgi:D-alanyl-D-alanine dipeptidase